MQQTLNLNQIDIVFNFFFNCIQFVNKIVGIKFGAHGAFLEQPSSGTFNAKRLKSQVKSFVGKKTKGNKLDKKHRLRLPISEGSEP